MEQGTLLKIENLSKTYPGVKALKEINMEINRGEVHALVGANGAGKSTLIKILGGVVKPDDGAIISIDGTETNIVNAIESVEKGISIIYQDLGLFQNLSVFENIAITNITENNKVIHWNQLRTSATEAIKLLNVNIDLDEIVEDLSMAKQQLVAIARALAHNSKLIIMDEPTSALSKDEVAALLDIIGDLKSTGISILFVSHKLEELLQVSDSYSILKDGEYVGTYYKPNVNKEMLIKLMVGQDIVPITRNKISTSKEEVLRVEKLSKRGNFKDISFSLHKGEILGITGIVGAGRSELAQAIFGINIADSGKLFIRNKQTKINSVQDAIKNKIAYVPENRQVQGLLLKKTVQENVVLANIKKLLGKCGLVDEKKMTGMAKEWIQKLNILPPNEKMLAQQLSGGNQQRVVIAKWLCTSPEILIVDEPTNGVDIAAKKEICDLFRSMADTGISVILISSELEEIFDYSDRVMVMRKGRVSGMFNIEDVSHELILSKAVLEQSDFDIKNRS